MINGDDEEWKVCCFGWEIGGGQSLEKTFLLFYIDIGRIFN